MSKRDEGADLHPIPGESPIIVLVEPQMADNIGMVARAMANGGLFHLRLVKPRDGWPNERAIITSSGAHRILEQATVHDSVDDAVADCHRVFATCPRPRHIVINTRNARAAAEDLRTANAAGQRVAVLFGPERNGLTAEDIARADTLVKYPLNPAHNSLNLAQAVMILAYEWWMVEEPSPPRALQTHGTHVATKGELDNFMGHLLDELDACAFLRNEAKRPGMVRNLRHWFERGEVTEQELRTLHGVVAELSRGRMIRGRKERE
ncbi:RNA methyltransferase [Rhodovarius crocodyli]|uniref:RNA methyltransferase n=1 Tax=Rhodovarius crocodyli TaxID=1979269 RepID=A0A437MPP2_9PROT|nr:RNA methyltransferase [Rhodovarius crocodyli]RVT99610.1 RNA methyltransferase [Rhodovarius crocodyli]